MAMDYVTSAMIFSNYFAPCLPTYLFTHLTLLGYIHAKFASIYFVRT